MNPQNRHPGSAATANTARYAYASTRAELIRRICTTMIPDDSDARPRVSDSNTKPIWRLVAFVRMNATISSCVRPGDGGGMIFVK